MTIDNGFKCPGSFRAVPDNRVHKGADGGDCVRCPVCSHEVPVWFAELWHLDHHMMPVNAASGSGLL